MKDLHFLFKTNNNIIYDEDVKVTENNDYILFDLDNQKFKVKLFDKFHFVKETESDIFEIYETPPSVLITLKEQEADFSVELDKFEHNIEGCKHTINYVIESDSEDVKCIVFELH